MNTLLVKPSGFSPLKIIAEEIVVAYRREAEKPNARPREQVVEEVLARYFAPDPHMQQPPDSLRMNTSEPAADGAAMWARLIANSVAPTIRAIRQVVFGDVAPPFPDYSEAVRWLEREGKPQVGDGPEIVYWAIEPVREERPRPSVLTVAAAKQWLRHAEPPVVGWQIAVGGSAAVPAATDQLRTIAEAVGILGVLTPWGPEAVLMHLLCGALPVGPTTPTVTFSGPVSAVGLGRRARPVGFRATIEVFPWQVAALPTVAEDLKKHWSLEQERWLPRGDDAKLADLIAVHGLPPQPGRGRNAGTLEGWDKIAKASLETPRKKADALQVRKKANALRMQWGRRFRKRWPRFAAELGDGRGQ